MSAAVLPNKYAFILCALAATAPNALHAHPNPEPDAGDTADAAELQELKASINADTPDEAPGTAPMPAPVFANGNMGVRVGPRGGVQSMNPDLAAILDVAAAAFNVDDPMQLGEHDPQFDGFTLQQLELYVGANVDPFFRVDANVIFTSHGIELEEAYITSLGLPANLQLRGGQFLSRFGRINSQHPHQWHFVDAPLVIGKFYGGDGDRNIGGELSWLIPLPWYAEVIASATQSEGRSYGNEAAMVSIDDTQWTGALKQFFPFTNTTSLLWGLSGQTAANTHPDAEGVRGRTAMYGTDIYLRYRPNDVEVRQSIALQAEAMGRTRTYDTGDIHRDWGGYAQLLWSINPVWETGVRAEYVSGLAEDPLDEDWTAGRDRYAAQLTYYPTHFSRVRAQVLTGHPRWQDKWIVGGFVTLEIVAGAHGAHVY